MNNLLLDFVSYVFYRLFQFLLHSIQKHIIWRLNGNYDHLAKITSNFQIISKIETCQLFSIVYRKKIVEGDVPSGRDFIWWHDKFVDPDQLFLQNPNWSLYTLDKDFAYFLLMPQPWPYYNAREAPFVFMRQFADARKLARMPLKVFCQFADKSLTNPKGPVVYFSCTARSGSTLLTRVMQVSKEKIICLAEPDGFSVFILYQLGLISESFTMELLKAIFKFYCKEQTPGQTYLIKVQSNVVGLVPLIKRAMPRVKHMYTFRRNTRKVLSSQEKMLRGAVGGDLHAFLWKIWPPLASHFFSVAYFEYDMCKRFGLKDALDFAIITHVLSFYHYHKNKHHFNVPLIYYEDFIADKEKTLQSIFELCELSFDEWKEKALDEFKSDSQAGTVLSQDNMKSVQDTVLDEVKILKINDICDQLKIPRLEI